MHLVINFRPFVLTQQMFVYSEDDQLVSRTEVELDKVVDTVNGLRSQFNIQKISLYGNQDYLSRFAAELNTNFSNNSVEIEIKNHS